MSYPAFWLTIGFLGQALFTARFLGFGPAVFGTVLSVPVVDYFAFDPRFRFACDLYGVPMVGGHLSVWDGPASVSAFVMGKA